jgi:hypothetical protein
MSYYDHFDRQTNNGRVFDTDLSKVPGFPMKHLTATEITERENWRNKMLGIYAHYVANDAPQMKVTTTELLLQQRVMVPNLSSSYVSCSRSQFKEARKGRRYPNIISEWAGFEELVNAFQPEHRDIDQDYSDIFELSTSFTDTDSSITLSDEKEEEGYMHLVLKKSLLKAGLVVKFRTVEESESRMV